MAKIWNEAVAEWQRKMGVDLTSPEAILFGSKEAVVGYITRMEEESQGDLEKSQWRRLGDTLVPLARAFKKLCAPIGDILSSTATVEAQEEFELMTDAFDEIKVHLRVVEIVAAHPGRLLYDSSIELLAQIITVLGVVMQMRREKYAGLRRIISRYKEEIIAGTLEGVTYMQASDEMERILEWLKYDSVDSFQRISSLLNDRAKGTCLWFLENHAFVDLMEGQRSMLPIQGQAGCGKSTLLYVIDMDSFLSSLLCQLALKDQGSIGMLVKARQQSISNGCFTCREKLDALVRMLNGRVKGFLVIDALDEALEHEYAKVLGALRKLCSCTNLSILVSTRGPLADEDPQDAIVSIDRLDDNTDIRTALDIEFSDGGRLSGIAQAEMVRNNLMLKSEGKFLDRLLVEVPPTLQGLYAEQLNAIPSGDVEDLWHERIIFGEHSDQYTALEKDIVDILGNIKATSAPVDI
ncbi:hypothetical protein EV714DRAFT_191992, partial [Schizophyllum commune]